MKLFADELYQNPWRQDDFFDDFNELDVVARWLETSDDGNAAVTLVADGSWTAAQLDTGDGATNQECYLSSNQAWVIENNRPIQAEFAVKFTEADTDNAAVVAGLSDGWAANFIVDTTGVLVAAGFDGACFYKVPGETAWNFKSSITTTSTISVIADHVAGNTSQLQLFRILIRPISSTVAEVVPLMGVTGEGSHFSQCLDATSRLPIKHFITYDGFVAAAIGFGVKAAGGTNNTETIQVGHARMPLSGIQRRTRTWIPA